MDLSDFDQSHPPQHLYKYLSAERIENVLENGTVRFTPLMDTNDTFEVRATFDKVAGPKFIRMLVDQMEETLSENSLNSIVSDLLKKANMSWMPPQFALKLIEQEYGSQFKDMMRVQMQEMVDRQLLPYLNDSQNAWELLEKMGRDLFCFSLSERMDITPMWAHYADNHRGFVVAFNTDHEWFHKRKDGHKTRVQKVAYFDGKVEEPLENPQNALISKTTDWAYEREWRLYIKQNQVERVVGSSSEPIHLIEFPPDSVDRIILGAKMDSESLVEIKSICALRYPHAGLFRALPNRQTHTYDEVPL